MKIADVQFPEFSGIRCLMMPYIQGDPDSIPSEYRSYSVIIESVVVCRGDIGYLTIDESMAKASVPHRGARAKFGRAIHTEAGKRTGGVCAWGWGSDPHVLLDEDTVVLLANSVDDSCAIWDATHFDTSEDGDIGHVAHVYPYEAATLMKAGEVHSIGILTPHESLPLKKDTQRQFLRIVSSGVHGREPYFTENPLLKGIDVPVER